MPLDIFLCRDPAAVQFDQQAIEQSNVAAGSKRQVQVGNLAGLGAARIDHHDVHPGPCALGRLQALKQDGMTPGEIAADQHDEIGQFEILVEARHRVGAEGALVARHRRGHAESGVGVDVGRAEKAFDQLVGGVVVLGKELARDVEGHGIGPMLGDDITKAASHRVERRLPRDTPAIDLGMKQPVFQRQSLAQRRALRAEPPAIGRMI